MGRMIDADNITYESIDSSDTVREEIKSGCGILAVRKEDIDVMPTIEERKTGEWIRKISVVDCATFVGDECSQCGYFKSMGQANFCPNCGADMRGRNNETIKNTD